MKPSSDQIQHAPDEECRCCDAARIVVDSVRAEREVVQDFDLSDRDGCLVAIEALRQQLAEARGQIAAMVDPSWREEVFNHGKAEGAREENAAARDCLLARADAERLETAGGAKALAVVRAAEKWRDGPARGSDPDSSVASTAFSAETRALMRAVDALRQSEGANADRTS